MATTSGVNPKKRKPNEEERHRRENWSAEEFKVLFEEREKRKRILDAPKSLPNYNQSIASAWRDIASEVNKVSAASKVRTPAECQERFRKKKSELKTKSASVKKTVHQTGGGTPESTPLTQQEYSMLL